MIGLFIHIILLLCKQGFMIRLISYLCAYCLSGMNHFAKVSQNMMTKDSVHLSFVGGEVG